MKSIVDVHPKRFLVLVGISTRSEGQKMTAFDHSVFSSGVKTAIRHPDWSTMTYRADIALLHLRI